MHAIDTVVSWAAYKTDPKSVDNFSKFWFAYYEDLYGLCAVHWIVQYWSVCDLETREKHA